jgi:hypothetical protein
MGLNLGASDRVTRHPAPVRPLLSWPPWMAQLWLEEDQAKRKGSEWMIRR